MGESPHRRQAQLAAEDGAVELNSLPGGTIEEQIGPQLQALAPRS
jgi:hypothetical protein